MTTFGYSLEERADYFVGRFEAMASDCEVLIDSRDQKLAECITSIVAKEVHRIEHKYSRYRDDNLLHAINLGKAVQVDDETAQLLHYAQQLFLLSEGRFDITSGVLRRVWHFDGSSHIPSTDAVDALLPLIGWEKVHWSYANVAPTNKPTPHKNNPQIQLDKGMEIDFGGIGKEYAADRAAQCVLAFFEAQPSKADHFGDFGKTSNSPSLTHSVSVLVNLGGDLSSTGKRSNGEGWQVGIETGMPLQPDAHTTSPLAGTPQPRIPYPFSLNQGGVATSGNAHRFLEKDGVRYSHVLDPRTGWPVNGAPSSVTVLADTCTDAGMISTLALLHGSDAEVFLQAQKVPYWCQW